MKLWSRTELVGLAKYSFFISAKQFTSRILSIGIVLLSSPTLQFCRYHITKLHAWRKTVNKRAKNFRVFRESR